jgi:hypothetical protein
MLLMVAAFCFQRSMLQTTAWAQLLTAWMCRQLWTWKQQS